MWYWNFCAIVVVLVLRSFYSAVVYFAELPPNCIGWNFFWHNYSAAMWMTYFVVKFQESSESHNNCASGLLGLAHDKTSGNTITCPRHAEKRSLAPKRSERWTLMVSTLLATCCGRSATMSCHPSARRASPCFLRSRRGEDKPKQLLPDVSVTGNMLVPPSRMGCCS